jgi:Zn-dependent protease with chaperone function
VTVEPEAVRVKTASTRWSIGLGFMTLLLAVGVVLFAAWFILGWFSTLQRELATAIITGFVAVIVSIVSVLVSKYFDRKREIEQAQRAKEGRHL